MNNGVKKPISALMGAAFVAHGCGSLALQDAGTQPAVSTTSCPHSNIRETVDCQSAAVIKHRCNHDCSDLHDVK